MNNVNAISHIATESAIKLGKSATATSLHGFETVTKELLENKALYVAERIENYFYDNQYIQDFTTDSILPEIAVQTIGETGYTFVVEETKPCNIDSAIIRYHKNPRYNGIGFTEYATIHKLEWIKQDYTSMVSGYYRIQTHAGNFSEWFFYAVTIGGQNVLIDANTPDYKPLADRGRFLVFATINVSELQSTTDDIQSNINNSITYTSENIEIQRESLLNKLLLIALLLIVASVGLATLLARNITKPVIALTQSTKLISTGDFNQKVTAKTGDEIEELAIQFNKMAYSLRESYSDLEDKIEERTKYERIRSEQLRLLNEIIRKISSILTMDKLLPFVVTCVHDYFNYDAYIFIKNSTTSDFSLQAIEYLPEHQREFLEKQYSRLLNNVVDPDSLPLDITTLTNHLFHTNDVKSNLAVPIIIGNRLLGIIILKTNSITSLDEIDLYTIQTLGDAIAIAVENSYLYEKAEELASIKERQRFASELHDAVSQTLFSANLIAESIPFIWENSKDQGKSRTQELAQLIKSAMNEMRSLMASYYNRNVNSDFNLPVRLHNLTIDASKHTQIPIEIIIEGQRNMPQKVATTFYRVAQEALHNINRHAHAQNAALKLQYPSNSVELTISDDGVGFFPNSVQENHLGLAIMQQRAHDIQAVLSIISEIGAGTTIKLTWDFNNGGQVEWENN